MHKESEQNYNKLWKVNFFKLTLKRSDSLLFKQLSGFWEWILFLREAIEHLHFYFRFSLSTIKRMHLYSNRAFMKLIESFTWKVRISNSN